MATRRLQRLQVDPDAAAVVVVAVVQQAFGVADDLQDRAAQMAIEREDRGIGTQGEDWERDDSIPRDQSIDLQPEIPDDVRNADEDIDEVEGRNIPCGDTKAMDQATAKEMECIREVMRIPLYEGSPTICLEAVILQLNLDRANNTTNVLINQSFALMHRVLLPQPNTFPDSEYAASQMLRKLGLEFKCIDVCSNNCVLYRGVFRDHQLCPCCGIMRRRRHGKSWISQKVLRHFPLHPRLQQMYRSLL